MGEKPQLSHCCILLSALFSMGAYRCHGKKRASEVQFVKACTYSAECSQNKDAEYNSIFTACLQQSSDLHDGHNTPLYINEAS